MKSIEKKQEECILRVFAMHVSGLELQYERWGLYLSKERWEKSKKRAGEQERRLYLGAEILLNHGLKTLWNDIVLPVAYIRNVHGKPYLLPPNDQRYVNWSHSGDYVLCAVADQEVGVDLQYMRSGVKESLVKRALQPEEMEVYKKIPPTEREKCFYQYWVLKESYLKAMGTGFHTSLSRFYVDMEGQYPQIRSREDETHYDCRLLEFRDAGYAAAVCCVGKITKVEIEYPLLPE